MAVDKSINNQPYAPFYPDSDTRAANESLLAGDVVGYSTRIREVLTEQVGVDPVWGQGVVNAFWRTALVMAARRVNTMRTSDGNIVFLNVAFVPVRLDTVAIEYMASKHGLDIESLAFILCGNPFGDELAKAYRELYALGGDVEKMRLSIEQTAHEQAREISRS